MNGTHSLGFSAPFRKLPSWPLAFSFPGPHLVSIATASPSLGASPQFCLPLLSTALPVSSVWVGSGIRVPRGRARFSQGRRALVIPLRPYPRLFKCPDLMTGLGFLLFPFSASNKAGELTQVLRASFPSCISKGASPSCFCISKGLIYRFHLNWHILGERVLLRGQTLGKQVDPDLPPPGVLWAVSI